MGHQVLNNVYTQISSYVLMYRLCPWCCVDKISQRQEVYLQFAERSQHSSPMCWPPYDPRDHASILDDELLVIDCR